MGKKYAPPPSKDTVHLWVKQGKTEHMATLVDPTILSKLKETREKARLLLLPSKSSFSLTSLSIFDLLETGNSMIAVCWSSTNQREYVEASTIKFRDLDTEGRGSTRGRSRSRRGASTSISTSTLAAPPTAKRPKPIKAKRPKKVLEESNQASKSSILAASSTSTLTLAMMNQAKKSLSLRHLSLSLAPASAKKGKALIMSSVLALAQTTKIRMKVLTRKRKRKEIQLDAMATARADSNSKSTTEASTNSSIVTREGQDSENNDQCRIGSKQSLASSAIETPKGLSQTQKLKQQLLRFDQKPPPNIIARPNSIAKAAFIGGSEEKDPSGSSNSNGSEQPIPAPVPVPQKPTQTQNFIDLDDEDFDSSDDEAVFYRMKLKQKRDAQIKAENHGANAKAAVVATDDSNLHVPLVSAPPKNVSANHSVRIVGDAARVSKKRRRLAPSGQEPNTKKQARTKLNTKPKAGSASATGDDDSKNTKITRKRKAKKRIARGSTGTGTGTGTGLSNSDGDSDYNHSMSSSDSYSAPTEASSRTRNWRKRYPNGFDSDEEDDDDNITPPVKDGETNVTNWMRMKQRFSQASNYC